MHLTVTLVNTLLDLLSFTGQKKLRNIVSFHVGEDRV